MTEPGGGRQHDHEGVEPVVVGLAKIGVQLAGGVDEVVGAIEHANSRALGAPVL